MLLRSLAAMLVAAAVAAGCTSQAEPASKVPQTSTPGPSRDTRASTTTTTAPPTVTGFVGTAEELRAQLLTHGICDELTTFTPLLPVTVTGLLNCDDGYLVLTLPSTTERDTVLLYAADQPCADTTYLAVSDTWIVYPDPATEARASEVADILGGEVRAVPCDRD